jgi:hypothetical protein
MVPTGREFHGAGPTEQNHASLARKSYIKDHRHDLHDFFVLVSQFLSETEKPKLD